MEKEDARHAWKHRKLKTPKRRRRMAKTRMEVQTGMRSMMTCKKNQISTGSI